MKRTWRKKIGAVVALLAAVAVLGTGCGADAAGAVESRTRETRALGLLLSRDLCIQGRLYPCLKKRDAHQYLFLLFQSLEKNP